MYYDGFESRNIFNGYVRNTNLHYRNVLIYSYLVAEEFIQECFPVVSSDRFVFELFNIRLQEWLEYLFIKKKGTY